MDEDWVDVEASNTKDIPIRSVNVDKSTDKPANKSTERSTDLAIEFYRAVSQGTLKRLEASKSPIFQVELGSEPIYSTFVENLAPELRQEYTCSTCKHFTDKYGKLALVKEDGTLEPLLWSQSDLTGKTNIEDTFGRAVHAVHQRFIGGTVTTEFKVIDKNKKTENEEKGGFKHFHLDFPASRVRKEELKGFTSANTAELADMLARVLADYKLGTIRKVNQIIMEDKLSHVDSHKASAKWLLELVEQDKMSKARGEDCEHNLLYRYAALSFVGSLKQMRSGALATLLENVKDNRPWTYIKAQWDRINDPTQYMRPQAAPSAGNIAAAERLFEQLGLTKDDLKRRLLVQDEVPGDVVMWASQAMKDRLKEKEKEKEKPDTSAKVFGAVRAKSQPTFQAVQADLPETVISFTAFVTKVLPTAKKVEAWLDSHETVVCFITGLEGSKPLMQWHTETNKNLVTEYLWTVKQHVSKHGLRPKEWNEVRCLVPFPWLWDGPSLTTTFPLLDPDGKEGDKYIWYQKKHGFRYLFVLEEHHETLLNVTPIFPEDMKSEFHGVRSTIEAFTRTEKLLDVKDGMARGGFVGGVEAGRGLTNINLKLRVTKHNGEVGVWRITLFE